MGELGITIILKIIVKVTAVTVPLPISYNILPINEITQSQVSCRLQFFNINFFY